MIYGVFYPYHKNAILDYSDPEYHCLPDYPREFRRIHTYKNGNEMMNAFANTMCPASRTFMCEEEDYQRTIEDLHNKFDDAEWLKKNVEPYL